ncbi:hypothetical protein ACN08X_00115 [Rothia sp. P6271]|uniref:hypothetical protein n=1 Tax=Rothia sp. P6271 TaxID=3402659 RepID=UPI003ACC0003
MEKIFRDYEAQLDSLRQQELESSAHELQRAEFAKVQQLDRLAAQQGKNVRICCSSSISWNAELETVGNGWVQLRSGAENILLPLRSIMWWEGGNHHAQVDTGTLMRKLNFSYAFRALSIARTPLRIFHRDFVTTTEGTIEKVGLDFIEVALHPLDGQYRSRHITGMRTVGLENIGAACSLRSA